MSPENQLEVYRKVKRREEIAQALREKIPYKQIQERFQCSATTISNVKKCLNSYGTVLEMHPKKRSGRPPTLTMNDKLFVRDVYAKYPVIFVEEVVRMVEEVLLVPDVSRYTIGRVLKELNYTRKTVSRAAKQQDELLRSAYLLNVAQYKPDQLVFLDESAFNEHTTFRSKGYSLRGTPIAIQQDLKKSERVSLIAALSYRGFLAYDLEVGSYNSGTFAEFVQFKLLPKMNAFPAPNSVLVLDNCAIHGMEGLRAMCQEKGVVVVELPPYSPDFNPIEISFAYVKRYLRTYYPASTIDVLAKNVMMAVEFGVNTARKSQACFNHRNYWYDPATNEENEFVEQYQHLFEASSGFSDTEDDEA